ncbi:hypothetical protein phiPsa397_007 [Pseudomonas phage phiPsa397]|uniref:Uncharacterized protein n=1 Tax=Pseudomonas phage phiPsa397 TaxID=1460367 RepID=A0A7G9V3C6_9CAUD|nr:hypothetical protein QGX16_gp007 [Pseudomonas phage phiPsa397]QNO00782.1 hypothetical protein phiPsa397_007 [Pseudomonas phage phiPsa397]
MVDTLIDKRPCYVMETGYTSSDFSFYNKFPDSEVVDRAYCMQLQSTAGREKWYQIDAYTHYWKNGYGSDRVLVLVNDTGVQIETCYFGWRNVPTEHDLAMREKVKYNNFLAALAECGKLCPNGASRWFNEAVLENFEHTFEEILYYGEEDA